MKNPVVIKILVLCAITVLLMVGLGMVGGVVQERQRTRAQVSQSVADSLAGPQTLMGPLVYVACTESWNMLTGKATSDEKIWVEHRREFMQTAMPDSLTIQAVAAMEPLARGLHKVNAYNLKSRITAQWASLASLKPVPTKSESRIQCGAPTLMLAVNDARGIRTAQLTVAGKGVVLQPGTGHPNYLRGVHTRLAGSQQELATGLQTDWDVELVGTEKLSFVPLGGTTDVQLSSSWPHPSFGGRFLPAERSVTPEGFKAQWHLSALATTAGQDVAANKPVCIPATSPNTDGNEMPAANDSCADSFSVGFVEPVNLYSLSDRATKYGVLFIALTFLAVGMFEVMARLRVHPMQYLLVGCGISIFFLLLVSLSEHLGFNAAYLVAATACVLLLGHYATSMLGSVLRGVPFGAGIALLYGLLFVLLQLEQTAMAVGAVALFAVLALVMGLTRKLDWYALVGNASAARAGNPPLTKT